MQVMSSWFQISSKAVPIHTMNLETFPWQTASFLKPNYSFHLCITAYSVAETSQIPKGLSQQQKPKSEGVWCTVSFPQALAIPFQCNLCRYSKEKEKSKSDLCLFSSACHPFSFAWPSLIYLSVRIVKITFCCSFLLNQISSACMIYPCSVYQKESAWISQ